MGFGKVTLTPFISLSRQLPWSRCMKNPNTRTPLLGCYRVEFAPGVAGIIEIRRRPDRFLELVTHGKSGYDAVLRMATPEELRSIGAKHALTLCDGVCVWLEESSGT